MSTDFFSSLNGKFDLNSSMSNLYGDYNTIKSGAYSTLMKSYVGKVGNKAALNAYRETGSTTGETAYTTKKSSASKSSFLDNYFSEKTESQKKASSDSAASATTETTTDKYSKYKSSWLDDQLKQYDKDANKTTAADTSVSVDTTI